MPRPRSLLLFVFLILVHGLAFGADPTGSIVGTVVDPSGHVVSDAAVEVRNQETNILRETRTTAAGDYSVPLLPPGIYQVTIAKSSFSREAHGGVQVDVNSTVRVDAALQIGALEQTIVVNDQPPSIDSDSSVLGHVVERRQIRDLPLNERNFISFTLLVPGAQLPPDGSQNSVYGATVAVNGAREQSNNFLLDGTDNNDSAINHYSMLPSVDAIREFQVQSSNSSAEFGRSGGAQINVVLNSGTNKLHGTAFDFFRNRHLDARNFFDAAGDIPRYDRNQFGGTVGGPIKRDRTFFFLSYESLRLRQAITRGASVPSQVQLAAALNAVPPAQRDPAGLAVLRLYPAANVGTNLQTSNRFIGAPVLRDTTHQPLMKLDHEIGANDRLSAHYGLYDTDMLTPYDPFTAFTSLPGFGDYYQNRGQNLGLTYTHIFNGRLINELRPGFNRASGAIVQQSRGRDRSRELGFPEGSLNKRDFGYPNLVIAGYDSIGEPYNTPQSRHGSTFQVADTLAWNPQFAGGRHQLRFGADVRRVRLNFYLDGLSRGEWIFVGAFTGDPLQDLLRGLPVAAVTTFGATDTGIRSTSQNYFVQDDFHISPRFTLNAGLRYEYNSPPVDIRNRLSVPDFSSHSATCTPAPDCQFLIAGTGSIPRATYGSSPRNFAPRLGFAWRPLASERLVVRSAYGIFYDVGILNFNVAPRFNPPFFGARLFLNDGLRNIQSIVQVPPTGGQVNPSLISPDYHDGYLQQWNFDVQQELAGTVFDVAYVGSKGTHLLNTRNVNQPRPGGAPPYPQFGPAQLYESEANSSYHSLQARAERRFRRGLMFLASYTWSKSLDDGSAIFASATEPALPQDSSNLRAERARSSFDAAHRFVLSSIYDLPFGGRIFGGWQASGVLSLQTGHAFTVNRGIDQSGTGTFVLSHSDRPDQIADPYRAGPVAANSNPACHATQSQGGLAADKVGIPESWFNPCAFDAAAGRFGSAGRNALTGPGFANLDFAVLKNFALRETDRVQLRLEAFNLLNHPNFDTPDRVYDSPNFGKVLSSNAYGLKPPRQLQIALKYIF